MTSVLEALSTASKLQLAGKNEQAQNIYNLILKECPQHPEALIGLGVLAQKSSQMEMAETFFKSSLEVAPNLVKGLFRLGFLYQTINQSKLSEEYYRKVISIAPNSIPAQNNLGYLFQQQGRLDEAIDLYQSILQLEPNCGEASINLANILYEKGELSPNKRLYYADLNLQLGLEKKNSGTIKDALYYFQQATRLNPQLATAYLQIGIVLRDDLGHLDKAVTYFTKVLSLVPDLAEAQLELGRTYQVLGNSSEAVNAFKAWINLLNPRYAVLPNIDETIPNLVEYTPPSMRFEEMLVGEHRFPKIPRVATSDKNRPFWSVVIPALNRPEYFFECLASVLAQWSGQDTMEIMVLDNGSSPPLFNIVNALGKGIIRYYRFPETVPLQENWNTMVALSRGEWVYLLQHDDYVLPGFFDRLKNSLETCPDSVGAAFTDYQNINERRKVIFTQDYGLNQYQGIVKDWVNRIGKSNPTSPPALVIRRAAYESVGGYKLDLPYTCDWEFYQRVATAYDWWHEPGFLAHYRQYSNSLTLQDSFNGVAGAAHRQAIEIAYTYLPVELRDEITQNSRRFHFDWCIQRAVVAVRHDALLGAMKLAQEALLIDTSQEANARFLRWLDTPTLTPLRAEFSRKIFPDIPPDDVRWTLETVIQIKRLEL